MTPADDRHADLPNVSRETFGMLLSFCALIEKWNPAINLVAKSDLKSLWRRHVLDSAQIFDLAPMAVKSWCDIGSGGGFPGIVVAILAKEKTPDLVVTLIESDRRKCVFLTESVRLLGLNARVVCARAQEMPSLQADVVSARALAPLSALCGFAAHHLRPEGVGAFLKGANAAVEVLDAQKLWSFALVQAKSRTDSAASLLFLRNITRV